VLCPRAPAGAAYSYDRLGHLKYHLRLQCPEELGVVMREMSLDGVEELRVGAACELRPALALRHPPLLFADPRHLV
jgi:hypothetical protein